MGHDLIKSYNIRGRSTKGPVIIIQFWEGLPNRVKVNHMKIQVAALCCRQDYYSTVGRTRNLIKLRSGEVAPSEYQGPALWDKQYLSNVGWAPNLLKFQN